MDDLAAGPPDGPDDRELLAAHVAGDDEAFGLLFARHRARLWAVALRTTSDPEDAADALQEAVIAAFRRAASYRGDAAVTTWLHRIVVNACLDRLRRRKVRRAEPLPEDLDRFVEPETAGTAAMVGSGAARSVDPADAALSGERRTAVLAALATLPAEQRASLVLVDMEGFSVAETAEILGVAPGTVKSRCSRGRAKLAPVLSPYARNPPVTARVPSAGLPHQGQSPPAARPHPEGGERP